MHYSVRSNVWTFYNSIGNTSRRHGSSFRGSLPIGICFDTCNYEFFFFETLDFGLIYILLQVDNVEERLKSHCDQFGMPLRTRKSTRRRFEDCPRLADGCVDRVQLLVTWLSV